MTAQGLVARNLSATRSKSFRLMISLRSGLDLDSDTISIVASRLELATFSWPFHAASIVVVSKMPMWQLVGKDFLIKDGECISLYDVEASWPAY